MGTKRVEAQQITDNKELDKLSGLSEKYGGANEVLKAVEAYTSHADINNQTTKVKTELGEIQGKIIKLETQYAHLKTATTMCNSLIQNYKFGLDSIQFLKIRLITMGAIV